MHSFICVWGYVSHHHPPLIKRAQQSRFLSTHNSTFYSLGHPSVTFSPIAWCAASVTAMEASKEIISARRAYMVLDNPRPPGTKKRLTCNRSYWQDESGTVRYSGGAIKVGLMAYRHVCFFGKCSLWFCKTDRAGWVFSFPLPTFLLRCQNRLS